MFAWRKITFPYEVTVKGSPASLTPLVPMYVYSTDALLKALHVNDIFVVRILTLDSDNLNQAVAISVM